MSPRAAWRLEALGFADVYDYVAGKADWLAAGLPTEGEGPRPARALDAADRDVPTCRPEEAATAVAARLGAGWDVCVVVNEAGIVQGRLVAGMGLTDGATVGEAMERGPTTVRADEPLADIDERMRRHRVGSVIVSTAQGELLGLLRAVRAERQPR